MIDASVLLLTFTDQKSLGFSGKMCLELNGIIDLDDNWYEPICKVFTNALRYDFFHGANIGGICQANREIINIAETYHPKYIIHPCTFSGTIVTEATLAALRKIGCIIVGYTFDDDTCFETRSRWLAPYIDYFISTGDTRGGIIEAYESIGARCILGLPLPINPTIFCKLKNVEKLYNATFVGGRHTNRLEYLANIASYGGDVKYLGGGHGQKVHFSEIVKIYNQSRINLNFTLGKLSPATKHIVSRVFEVTLSGGFLLTEYTAGLENYFEIGREIECFETAQEAAEKIQYYLKNSDELEQIAERGHIRAKRDYTGQVRLNKIFCEIEDDLFKRGRPILPPPVNEINILRKTDVIYYYRWACALRKSQPPLRNEWFATNELVLLTDPQHKAAKRLLRRAIRWGYPEPLLIWLCVKAGHILITLLKITKSEFASLTRFVKNRIK